MFDVWPGRVRTLLEASLIPQNFLHRVAQLIGLCVAYPAYTGRLVAGFHVHSALRTSRDAEPANIRVTADCPHNQHLTSALAKMRKRWSLVGRRNQQSIYRLLRMYAYHQHGLCSSKFSRRSRWSTYNAGSESDNAKRGAE